MSLNKTITIPVYETTYKGFTTPRKKKAVKPVDPFAFSHEDVELKRRLKVCNESIERMKQERKEILEEIRKRKQLRNQGRLRPVKLYALKLEDSCWYIGMSYNPERRFQKHLNGKGAGWTKLHKPIEIHEIRQTGEYIQDNASKLEDDMTIEYMLKYGSDYVRGGGWCQLKPKLPSIVVENELARYEAVV